MVPFDNWRWREGPVLPGRAVVFDIDGVLADATGRQHHLDGGWPSWDDFFAACGDDPLLRDNAALLDTIAADHAVVLLTARPLWVRQRTVDWLARHDLRWDLLLMRDSGDYMSAPLFKRRSVHELRAFGFDLTMAFEDDPRNVTMFRREGLACMYVHSGYFD